MKIRASSSADLMASGVDQHDLPASLLSTFLIDSTV